MSPSIDDKRPSHIDHEIETISHNDGARLSNENKFLCESLMGDAERTEVHAGSKIF